MLLWLIAYVTIGQVAVPITMSLLGLDREAMSIRSHAIVHLGIDVSQLAITLLILWRCLKPLEKMVSSYRNRTWYGSVGMGQHGQTWAGEKCQLLSNPCMCDSGMRV